MKKKKSALLLYARSGCPLSGERRVVVEQEQDKNHVVLLLLYGLLPPGPPGVVAEECRDFGEQKKQRIN